MANFEDPGAEGVGIVPGQQEPLQSREELLHPLQLQAGAEPAGENLTPGHGLRHRLLRHGPRLQVGLQQVLTAHGRLLGKVGGGHVGAVAAQFRPEFCQQLLPGAADEIHLGNEDHRRHPVVLQQAPQRPGVGLDAVDAADHQDGVVQHLQHPLRLAGEVHMAGRIQQGHVPVPQCELRLAHEDGDAPAALQLVDVHGGVAVVNAARLPQTAGTI